MLSPNYHMLRFILDVVKGFRTLAVPEEAREPWIVVTHRKERVLDFREPYSISCLVQLIIGKDFLTFKHFFFFLMCDEGIWASHLSNRTSLAAFPLLYMLHRQFNNVHFCVTRRFQDI